MVLQGQLQAGPEIDQSKIRRYLQIVHSFPQFLSGLEERGLFGGNIDNFTALGIARLTGASVPYGKAPESPDLYLCPFLQRLTHGIENQVYDQFRLFARQHAICIDNLVNKFTLRHLITS